MALELNGVGTFAYCAIPLWWWHFCFIKQHLVQSFGLRLYFLESWGFSRFAQRIGMYSNWNLLRDIGSLDCSFFIFWGGLGLKSISSLVLQRQYLWELPEQLCIYFNKILFLQVIKKIMMKIWPKMIMKKTQKLSNG